MNNQNQGASIEAAASPNIAEALHAAVAAIYFDDSSDYRTALYDVVQHLAPDLIETLENNPRMAWEKTDASRRIPAAATGELPPLPEPFCKVGAGNPGLWAERGADGGEPVFTAQQFREGQRAAIAADRAQRHAPAVREVPAGWQLVPVELTDEMIVAFAETWFSKVRPIDDCCMEDCYAAMLAASPATVTAPAQPNKLASYPLEEMGVESAPDATRLFRASDWQLTVGDVRVARALAAPAAQQAAPTGTLGYALFRNGKQEGIERSREMAERWVKAEIVPLIAAPATTGMVEDAKDAARYRVLRMHSAPGDVAFSMNIENIKVRDDEQIDECIDRLCDAALASQEAASAKNGEKGAEQ